MFPWKWWPLSCVSGRPDALALHDGAVGVDEHDGGGYDCVINAQCNVMAMIVAPDARYPRGIDVQRFTIMRPGGTHGAGFVVALVHVAGDDRKHAMAGGVGLVDGRTQVGRTEVAAASGNVVAEWGVRRVAETGWAVVGEHDQVVR